MRRTLLPTACFWRGNKWTTDDCLPPHISTLVYCSFCVLERAALGGGKLSIDLPLGVNMCFLAKFTVVSVQVQSYKSTINASYTDTQSSLSSDGSVNKVENAGVISLKDFDMSNAVFFSLPANDDTVLQPWNMGRESAFSYSSSLAMSTQECTSGVCQCRKGPRFRCLLGSQQLTLPGRKHLCSKYAR